MSKKVLVTGAAGYIGSHAVLDLLENGMEVVAVDSLERGYSEALDRVKELSGKSFEFKVGDLRDRDFVKELFKDDSFDCVIHFAAYKSVGEAEQKPDMYFDNNINSVKNLLELGEGNFYKFIFSSTAAVYDGEQEMPLTEESEVDPVSIYGQSKLRAEEVLKNHKQDSKLDIVILRYFNVIGTHPSGRIGEDPSVSTNLLPVILKSVMQEDAEFSLFGNQFDTRDGSQERDYIDVMDLVRAHTLAVEADLEGINIINLSTNHSTSCLEMIDQVEEVLGQNIEYELELPRKGDPEVLYASNDKAKKVLCWEPDVSINQSIKNQVKWASENPQGYYK